MEFAPQQPVVCIEEIPNAPTIISPKVLIIDDLF